MYSLTKTCRTSRIQEMFYFCFFCKKKLFWNFWRLTHFKCVSQKSFFERKLFLNLCFSKIWFWPFCVPSFYFWNVSSCFKTLFGWFKSNFFSKVFCYRKLWTNKTSFFSSPRIRNVSVFFFLGEFPKMKSRYKDPQVFGESPWCL